MTFPHTKRPEIVVYLRQLQQQIISTFESFEEHHSFVRKKWDHTEGGGGEIALLRGDVFEKAAVNWSGVSGKKFPMDDASGEFFATGVSVITHMHNPHAPTAHFNLRFIETEKKFWFGGGYDLTPMGFPYAEDTKLFHDCAREALNPFGKEFYPQFTEQARQYFYIPHHNKERGVGGIFFDQLNSGEFDKDFALCKSVAVSFLKAMLSIYEKRVHHLYVELDKEKQLKQRACYVEFNLLYDRGTRFGFASGGNPEAILCSMPPVVKW